MPATAPLNSHPERRRVRRKARAKQRIAAGRPSQTRYPNSRSIRTANNPFGYVSEVRNANDNALYWRADAMDAEGRVVRETYGNGVVTDRGFDPLTGRLQNIAGYKGSNQIQGHAYVYDTLGNVAILADGPGSQLEIRGGYDALNRLTQTEITINGVASQQNLTYNALGNITSKTGVGNYAYGDALHKHAVTGVTGGPVALSYAYDANGNLTGGAGRSITWTSWNMPASLTQSGQTQSWSYTPEHDRYKMAAPGRTTWYLNPGIQQGGHYEQTKYASGTVEHRVTLYGGGQPIGEVLTFDSGAPAQTRYYHSDQQGSITAVTDQTGTVVARYRYDPWGKQTQTFGAATGIGQTRQGHTGHEMLDGGLTHMNGRLYDPVLARFVSADPHVDNPFDLQSLNRYSYVNNNPLGFTDPSGYFKLFGKKWSWIRDKVVKPVVAAVVSYFSFGVGYWGVGTAVGGGTFGGVAGTLAGATLAGASTSLIATGSLDGWQYNALSAALFSGAGEIGQTASNAGRVALHATAGCISAAAAGGDCGQGAASAAVGKFTTIATLGWDTGAQFAAATVAGGTVSVIGGGKFANGAQTAAFGYLYNACSHLDDCLGELQSIALGFVPGYDLVQALNNPEAGVTDYAVGILGIVPGAGKAAGLSLKIGKGLGNPFKGKTATQIDEMFRAKGFEPRGPDPLGGKGGYVNPQTGRSYHIDEKNSFGEPPHVDVNRLKTYDGPLDKKKYFTGE